MSRVYSAGQYEQSFQPHRLCNWMAPDESKLAVGALCGGTLRARGPGTRTEFIVDERGHLLPGIPKISNAFTSGAEALGGVPPRWPGPLPALPSSPAATMGYKGIATPYLPSSTVTIQTVQVEGCREQNFA